MFRNFKKFLLLRQPKHDSAFVKNLGQKTTFLQQEQQNWSGFGKSAISETFLFGDAIILIDPDFSVLTYLFKTDKAEVLTSMKNTKIVDIKCESTIL